MKLYIHTVFMTHPIIRRGARPLLSSDDSLGYEPVRDPLALQRFMRSAGGLARPTQLTLAGTERNPGVHQPSRRAGEREPLGYGLFFAGFAEPEDNHRFCRLGSQLAHEHGLRNAVQSPERAHVTLCSLNRHAVLDQAVIDAARAAAERFPCPALPMVFDRAGSFAADGAFMLLCAPATQAAVMRLRRPLVAMLRRFGLKPDEVAMPHMTMVYRCGEVVAERPIPPMAWKLHRFALVLSHVGNTRHEWLGEWELPRQ